MTPDRKAAIGHVSPDIVKPDRRPGNILAMLVVEIVIQQHRLAIIRPPFYFSGSQQKSANTFRIVWHHLFADVVGIAAIPVWRAAKTADADGPLEIRPEIAAGGDELFQYAPVASLRR